MQESSQPSREQQKKSSFRDRARSRLKSIIYGPADALKKIQTETKDKQLASEVYFPASATIQINLTDRLLSDPNNKTQKSLATIRLKNGELLTVLFDPHHKVMYCRHGRKSFALNPNAPTTEGPFIITKRTPTILQIKTIQSGICSFDNQLCYAQDAFSRPNFRGDIPAKSREENALERLRTNPRFSQPTEDHIYGKLDGIPIYGVSSEKIAGRVYVGSAKAREAVFIPPIDKNTTPALYGMYTEVYKSLLKRRDAGQQAEKYVLADVVAIVRNHIPYSSGEDRQRVQQWLEANRLMDDGLINLESFAQYQIGTCTQLALITGLILEKLISDGKFSGSVRVEKTYQPGIGSHASVTYTSNSQEIQVDPTHNYIGSRIKRKNGWDYDVTFRMSREERKALDKSIKASKLPQRQQDAHQLHQQAWENFDKSEQGKPLGERLIINLREPSRTKVEKSIRRMPTWIIQNLQAVEPLSENTTSPHDLYIAAHVQARGFGTKSIMRCRQSIIESFPQETVDQIIAHEIGGHVLHNSIIAKSAKERVALFKERDAFLQANFSLILKDDYARRVLFGESSYEKGLKKSTAMKFGDTKPPHDKMRLHHAMNEFLANRMSEYLLTASGVEYKQTFFHREKPFTEEENRKCWHLCSMMYQSGQRLFASQR